MSDDDRDAADQLIIEMVEAERYEEALELDHSNTRRERTATFIRLSARHFGQDRVLIALNKARNALLSETVEDKELRLSMLSQLDNAPVRSDIRKENEELRNPWFLIAAVCISLLALGFSFMKYRKAAAQPAPNPTVQSSLTPTIQPSPTPTALAPTALATPKQKSTKHAKHKRRHSAKPKRNQ